MSYVKVVDKEFTYFIHVDNMDSWLRNRAVGDRSRFLTTLHASLILDNLRNSIVKCRCLIEEVVSGKFARPFMTITLEDLK